MEQCVSIMVIDDVDGDSGKSPFPSKCHNRASELLLGLSLRWRQSGRSFQSHMYSQCARTCNMIAAVMPTQGTEA